MSGVRFLHLNNLKYPTAPENKIKYLCVAKNQLEIPFSSTYSMDRYFQLSQNYSTFLTRQDIIFKKEME